MYVQLWIFRYQLETFSYCFLYLEIAWYLLYAILYNSVIQGGCILQWKDSLPFYGKLIMCQELKTSKSAKLKLIWALNATKWSVHNFLNQSGHNLQPVYLTTEAFAKLQKIATVKVHWWAVSSKVSKHKALLAELITQVTTCAPGVVFDSYIFIWVIVLIQETLHLFIAGWQNGFTACCLDALLHYHGVYCSLQIIQLKIVHL